MANTVNVDVFEHYSIPRALRQMAIPTIFAQLIVLIYNLADTFYVGNVGNPYMVAGASLILPVFNICLSLAGLTGAGGGALISRLLGQRREDEARKVACFVFYLSILIAGFFSVGMIVFMHPILVLIGASDNTYLYAMQYSFCVIVLGGIPTVLSNVMSNLIRSTGMSKEAGIGITMGGLINIILDPLFMFVLFPKGYEILGVGVAALLSNCLACAYFFIVIYLMRNHTVITFKPGIGLPEKKSIASIFNVGIPSAIATLLFDLDYVVIDKLMVSYGDIPLAAIGIVLKAERLPLNIGIGLCQGMMPLVGYNYSSKNYERMKGFIKGTILTGILVGILSICLYEVSASAIMRIFIDHEATVILGTDFLRIRCLATPLMFCSFFTVYVFQGFGEGRYSLFLGVMRWAVFNIPMLFLLNWIFGMYGIVWSQVTADVLTVTLSLIVYVRYYREHFGKN